LELAALSWFLSSFRLEEQECRQTGEALIIRDAEIKAERITKNAEIDAKQAAFEAKQNAQNEIRQMKQEIQVIRISSICASRRSMPATIPFFKRKTPSIRRTMR
jgi:hypothetical protein